MKNSFEVEGNIVDIVKKNVFKGIVHVHFGKITKIEKKDVKSEDYILPGLVDSHIHIESSMLAPSEFAKLAVRHGTVATVSDPHEIANVLGVYGIDYMVENGKYSPFKFYFGAPSCVPATKFETSGFELGTEVIKSLLKSNDIHFLAEVMNYPGIVNDDPIMHEKVAAGKYYNKPIDGHAPGLSGEQLRKYAAAGITTDHECVNKEEAIEKIKAGIKIQIREGSAVQNFNSLHQLIDEFPDMVMICTDDCHANELVSGHLNRIIRTGINNGLDFFNLYRAASYNTVKHYNLDVGLLQENDPADFIVIDNLESFNVKKTYINGNLLYDGQKVFFPDTKDVFINNFGRQQVSVGDIQIRSNESGVIKTIEVIEGELITNCIETKPNIVKGNFQPDIENDILKIVVASRYDNSQPAIGFIRNFGFKKGAISASIAHDSHNIVTIGTNDKDIVNAINSIVDLKGGLVAIDGKNKRSLPLEIAGLMTNADGLTVAKKYEEIKDMAVGFGSKLKEPFMTMSFMSLLVIPELKIGDKGMFDVNKFEFIS